MSLDAVFHLCASFAGRCRGASVRLAITALCAALAGCAAQSPERYAANDAPDWLVDESDPIGALILRGQTRQASLAPAPRGGAVPERGLAGAALNYLGIRYRWGGSDPATGFDCSGLVAYAAEQSLGLKLPRSAADIAQVGAPVARKELQAGDLVFFNTLGRRYSHVGIYLGGQRFVHAPSSGGVVRIERMDVRYWAKRYNGARRLEPSQVAEG